MSQVGWTNFKFWLNVICSEPSKNIIYAGKLQIGAERKSKFFRTQIIRTLNAFVSAMERSFFAYQWVQLILLRY